MTTIYDVLHRPLVTEKSNYQATACTSMFSKWPDATRTLVKDAVEKLFDVTVLRVNVMNVPAKRTRRQKPPDSGASTWLQESNCVPSAGRRSHSLKGWSNGVKVYKPVTPGLRGMTGYTFEEMTKKPERSLMVIRKEDGRPQCYGRVTVRHQGVATGSTSVWWISNGKASISPPKLRRSNTIRFGRLAWRCWSMPMARSAISWLPWV